MPQYLGIVQGETMLSGSTFGRYFKVTTFGESHGLAMGCIVDGCPAGVPLSIEEIQRDLDRRRPGQNRLSSTRAESDQVRILSGVFEGKTLGTPITLVVDNKDARSKDYREIADIFRPSHGDFSYTARYGFRDPRGGGRASARETVARVAAGGVARALCRHVDGSEELEVLAWVSAVANESVTVDPQSVTLDAVEASAVRCPDPEAAARMEAAILAAKKSRDTVGGVVTVVGRGVPAGLGNPVFEKLDAALAAGLMSIPAVKGVEVGSGFAGARMRGSEHNDSFVPAESATGVETRTNHSGGVQAGISNGMPLVCQVAFKPVATHFLEQDTVTKQGEATTFQAKGRHDPCVVHRAVPICEAMMLLVLADALLGARLARV